MWQIVKRIFTKSSVGITNNRTKLYVGGYCKEGIPATWTFVKECDASQTNRYIKKITPHLLFGMDLYIVNKKGVKAYYRDKLNLEEDK